MYLVQVYAHSSYLILNKNYFFYLANKIQKQNQNLLYFLEIVIKQINSGF